MYKRPKDRPIDIEYQSLFLNSDLRMATRGEKSSRANFESNVGNYVIMFILFAFEKVDLF